MGMEGSHRVGPVRVSVPMVCLPHASGTAPWGRAGLHSDRGVPGCSFGVLRARCMEQQAQAWHLKGCPLPVPVPAGSLGLEVCVAVPWGGAHGVLQACLFFGVDWL